MKTHRIHIDKKSEEPEHQLCVAIALIKTAEEARQFIQDLCTPAEVQAMADRWRVVDAIKAGKPYRQIYEETGVSVTTVGRVARSLERGEGGYNLIHKRIERKLHENHVQIKNRNSKKGST